MHYLADEEFLKELFSLGDNNLENKEGYISEKGREKGKEEGREKGKEKEKKVEDGKKDRKDKEKEQEEVKRRKKKSYSEKILPNDQIFQNKYKSKTQTQPHNLDLNKNTLFKEEHLNEKPSSKYSEVNNLDYANQAQLLTMEKSELKKKRKIKRNKIG